MKYLYRFGWYFLYAYSFIRRPSSQGAAVIVEKDNRVLMVRHTYGHRDQWYFPGGGRKQDEEAVLAAQRELYEETGLKLKLNYLGQVNGTEDWRKISDSYFHAEYIGSEIKKDPKEIAEYRWWPKLGLPKLSPLTKTAADKFL